MNLMTIILAHDMKPKYEKGGKVTDIHTVLILAGWGGGQVGDNMCLKADHFQKE